MLLISGPNAPDMFRALCVGCFLSHQLKTCNHYESGGARNDLVYIGKIQNFLRLSHTTPAPGVPRETSVCYEGVALNFEEAEQHNCSCTDCALCSRELIEVRMTATTKECKESVISRCTVNRSIVVFRDSSVADVLGEQIFNSIQRVFQDLPPSPFMARLEDARERDPTILPVFSRQDELDVDMAQVVETVRTNRMLNQIIEMMQTHRWLFIGATIVGLALTGTQTGFGITSTVFSYKLLNQLRDAAAAAHDTTITIINAGSTTTTTVTTTLYGTG